MASIIEITQLSPTMTEGVLVEWFKQLGDSISPGDAIASVETDKAIMDLEAYEEGVLLAQIVEKGVRLAVGAPIGILGEKGEDISSLLEKAKSAKSMSAKETTVANTPVATPEAKPATTPEPQPKPPAAKPASPSPSSIPQAPLSAAPSSDIKSSPLARKLAAQYGIPLERVTGTGPNGRIVERDVEKAHEIFSARVETFPAAERGGDTLQPLSMMRKVIAQRLSESKSTVPHFYITRSADISGLLSLRANLNASLESYGARGGSSFPGKISVNDFVIRASAMALRERPSVNASWTEDGILLRGNIDISVAVSIDDGLLTPVVRNADTKTIFAVSAEVKSLAKRARERKLKPEEFSDGSFSISNLGMYNVDEFKAIINPPEAAILAVGTSRKEPRFDEQTGEFFPADIIRLTLSCDHRVVDGAVAAEFMDSLAFFLENPALLM